MTTEATIQAAFGDVTASLDKVTESLELVLQNELAAVDPETGYAGPEVEALRELVRQLCLSVGVLEGELVARRRAALGGWQSWSVQARVDVAEVLLTGTGKVIVEEHQVKGPEPRAAAVGELAPVDD